jgi:uncharacterized membrane protein YfcA
VSVTLGLMLLASGLLAGLLAGLLGVGGGLVLVAALALVLPGAGVPPGEVMHVALATSLASILATSLSSTRAHQRRGAVMWPTVRWLTPGLLAGGALGALVAGVLPDLTLRFGVAGFCWFAAWRLATARTPGAGGDTIVPAGGSLSAWGVAIGAISALVGIGGGSMTVPLLIRQGASPVRAVGTSAACGFAIALASALGFAFAGRAASGLPEWSIGFVYAPAAALIALTSVLSAPYGAALAHRLRGDTLKRVFALFLVLMGGAVLLRA